MPESASLEKADWGKCACEDGDLSKRERASQHGKEETG